MGEWIGCDWRHCPAKSLVHILITGRQLHFCGHHADISMPRLLDIADTLVDDRETAVTA